MHERTSRRRFLAAAGAAAAGGLAGCTALQSLVGNRNRVGEDGLPPSEDADAQFRGNLGRRGVDPEAIVPEEGEITWELRGLNTGDHTAAKASPVLEPSGDIVVPGDAGEVWRVTPEGETVWSVEVTEAERGFHGTPAIANGAVYVGAYDGTLYALDLESGDRYWASDLGDAIGSSPAYYDGTVYVAVEYRAPSGAMFGVDAVDGEVVWEDHRPTDHPHSTCAIDREAGRIVVGANDGVLYAWTFPGLEREWTFETDGAIKGPVATYDGSAFVGSWDETFYRVDLADGTEEWAFESDDMVMTGPSIEPSTGTAYVGSHDSRLYAVDVETGDEDWSFDTRGSLIGCPTVTSEHVLVGSYDRQLYAIEKETGDQAWSVSGVGRVTSTPLVADEAVYFTDRASTAALDENDEGPTGALYRVG